MSVKDFKEGDVDYLKIGGPAMVIDTQEAYKCQYLYLYNGEIRSILVNYNSITKDKPSTTL